MDGVTKRKSAADEGVLASTDRQRKFNGAAHGTGGHAHMLAVDLPRELGGDAIAAEWGGTKQVLIDEAWDLETVR